MVVAALSAVACSSAVATHVEPAATPAPAFSPPAFSPPPVVEPEPVAPGPVLPPGTFVARSRTPNLTIWRGPSTSSGRRWPFPSRNAVGQPLSFLITAAARDEAGDAWLRILLPIRPNEAAGWVREDDVAVRRVDQRIVVDLSDRSLRYFSDGQLVNRFVVGIGRPETPTATGTFYIWAQVPQASASGPYGVFALGLSGFSQVLKDWPGGGRMAIHGTPNPADRGQMVSHGCVRVFNGDMLDLKRVPLGTPVIIKT